MARAAQLRSLLAAPGLKRMPCCFDALSAKLVERAGFPLTFMSGFAVSAARLAVPDTGMISYEEMVDQGRSICQAVDIPVIGDADTGFGNLVNAQRTVRGYARAGFAGIMIEDQVAPKRCGHVAGKAVVCRDEAYARMAAVCEARDALRAKGTGDLVIVARTDACTQHGLDEALERARLFASLGAEILFVEAPTSVEDLRRVAAELPAHTLVNCVEQGSTPILPPSQLERMGFAVVAYPLTLLSTAIRAMDAALDALHTDAHPPAATLLPFQDLKDLVGFGRYDAELARLSGVAVPTGGDSEKKTWPPVA